MAGADLHHGGLCEVGEQRARPHAVSYDGDALDALCSEISQQLCNLGSESVALRDPLRRTVRGHGAHGPAQQPRHHLGGEAAQHHELPKHVQRVAQAGVEPGNEQQHLLRLHLHLWGLGQVGGGLGAHFVRLVLVCPARHRPNCTNTHCTPTHCPPYVVDVSVQVAHQALPRRAHRHALEGWLPLQEDGLREVVVEGAAHAGLHGSHSVAHALAVLLVQPPGRHLYLVHVARAERGEPHTQAAHHPAPRALAGDIGSHRYALLEDAAQHLPPAVCVLPLAQAVRPA
mmetsp:Transcript_28400/g.62902  ORF Transcript_28400/g.62902 Transcript_28400/m.62902 type:complete len:286 (+) Transcript_28400:753-1610(+)